MKTNGIHGLNYHLFPGDLSNKLDELVVSTGISKVVNNGNEIHIFTGVMPSEEDLYKFEFIVDVIDVDKGYGANLAFSVGDTTASAFDVNYTYDNDRKERVMKKWPIDAKTYTSKITGDLTWAAIKLESVTSTGGKDIILFTDAIGTWDDKETIILVNKTVGVQSGESVEFKDFTIASRDILPNDVIAGVNSVSGDMPVAAGDTSVTVTFTNATDGSASDITVTSGTTTTKYSGTVLAGKVTFNVSPALISGDSIITIINNAPLFSTVVA